MAFGWNGTRYNPCKADQKDFVEALKRAFELNDKPVLNFGTAELEASIVFGLKPPLKRGKITNPPDVDNLVKFVFDALEKTCYANDAQITKYGGMEKRFDAAHGGNGYIRVSFSKRVYDLVEE